MDDRAGKPVAIIRVIGRQPVFAVGTPDRDRAMRRIRRREAIRVSRSTSIGMSPTGECAYDRGDRLAARDKALDKARASG